MDDDIYLNSLLMNFNNSFNTKGELEDVSFNIKYDNLKSICSFCVGINLSRSYDFDHKNIYSLMHNEGNSPYRYVLKNDMLEISAFIFSGCVPHMETLLNILSDMIASAKSAKLIIEEVEHERER